MRDPLQDPHGGIPPLQRGPAPKAARLTLVLIHGRGGSADDMMGLALELGVEDVARWALQAAGGSWYPFSFLAPLEHNQPGLRSGLGVLASLVSELEGMGVPSRRVAILGFSQGACLALEFVARNPRRYAAVVGLSGGLIGPPGVRRDYPGSLDGTPVFLGCSDMDPHIPLVRVRETAETLRRMGASVDERVYPRMGHTVNEDEMEAVRGLIGLK